MARLISTRRRKLRPFLYFFLFIYCFAATKIFVANLGEQIVFYELKNERNGSFPSCCKYRDQLTALFNTLSKDPQVTPEDSSKCKILMNEDIIDKAMKYGLPSTLSSRDRQTRQTGTARNSSAPEECSSQSYSQQPLPMTALASFPGSGNTWVRHLLQQLTGSVLVLQLLFIQSLLVRKFCFKLCGTMN